jgi:hypothetical protein
MGDELPAVSRLSGTSLMATQIRLKECSNKGKRVTKQQYPFPTLKY